VAPKNAIAQSSRKVTQSTSQGSTAVSTAFVGVMRRSMDKADASSARQQAIMIAKSKSLKVQMVTPK